MEYTQREIAIFLAGMKHARTQAILSGKGVTASNAITFEIQKLNLQAGVASHKGRIHG